MRDYVLGQKKRGFAVNGEVYLRAIRLFCPNESFTASLERAGRPRPALARPGGRAAG